MSIRLHFYSVIRYPYEDEYRYRIVIYQIIQISDNCYKARAVAKSWGYKRASYAKKVASAWKPNAVLDNTVSNQQQLTRKRVEKLFNCKLPKWL